AGQHICAIARLLRIPKIIIHPFASLFSALGMGLADVQLHREYHFQEIITPSQWKEVQTKIEKIFEDLQKKLDKELQVYTNLQKKIFQPYLDLRYQGQATEITIPYRKDKSPIPLFEEYHKRKFGHLHPARPIELVALRLKAIGKNPLPPLPTLSSSHHAPQPCDYTQIFFVDRFQKSPIFLWEHLRAKQKLQGPALILNPHLSIVIEPDFKAEVLENGSLLLTSTQISTPSYAPQKDPIQLEIFSKLFSSIAEQMGQSLQQSAFSTNIKERLDFSCAIFNKKGELIANAAHIPVHLGAMEETVKYLLQTQPHLRPGDTYITNHPFQGGSHLPDITAITPVFHNKKLAFFVANRGHHADIGGIVPGSMPAFSTSLQEEGVLIENFKLIDQGKPRYEALQQLLTQAPYPVRDLNERISDLEAQVSANTKGVHLLQEAVQKYGENILQNYMSYIQEAAEQKVRKLLLTYPNGNYFFEDKMDNGLKISVHIHIKEDEAIIDFSGTSPQDEHSNLNANTAITKAAILYVFRTLLQEDIPLNSGCLRPLQIHIPLGCFLNPTKEVAVVGGNVETSQRICDALLGALQATAASQGTMNNLSFGNKTFGYYETIAGGTGATPRQNGVDAVQSNMTNTRCTDPEIFESRYPARIERIHIRNNSGGQGKYRGGNGIIKRIRFSQSLTVSFLTSRRRIPPYGMQGGESGKAGLNLWIKQKKSKTILQPLPPTCTIEVQPQDAIEIHTPGGGGWQSPPPPPSVEELNQKIEKIPPNSLQNRRKIQKLVHQIRLHIRTNLWQKPTAGLAPNCIQANLIAIPQVYANEFLDYCQQNPRPCPLLEWLPAGEFRPHLFAPLGDIRTDVPLYNVHFHHKNFTAPSILPYWDDSISTFLLGCSFSFERALIQAGILLRHIQEKKNVAMYITNIPTQAAGRFKGNLVVSMRPIPKNQVEAAIDITQKFPFGHGEPIHIGNPKEIGISNLNQVDFGDAVEVQPDEVPVFWACGVSALLAVKNSKIPLYFTHSPGCMFLTDVLPTLE
ncbi:MAG: putative hydro-lyase, partial [Planctomycetota bacterium]